MDEQDQEQRIQMIEARVRALTELMSELMTTTHTQLTAMMELLITHIEHNERPQ